MTIVVYTLVKHNFLLIKMSLVNPTGTVICAGPVLGNKQSILSPGVSLLRNKFESVVFVEGIKEYSFFSSHILNAHKYRI